MSRFGRLGLFAGIGISALLLAGGAVTAYQELDIFRTGGVTPASRFAALAEGAYAPGPSLLSKRVLLDTCLEAITGIFGRLQETEQRQAMLGHCRTYADAIVAEAPSMAYGWYLGALAAAELGDIPGFNTRMAQSQLTGPSEQWIAQLRAPLVEDHFADASPDVRTRHEADLRLLVTSNNGIASISDRYVREPAFRERITAIVETMPEADQRRFVQLVRAAATP